MNTCIDCKKSVIKNSTIRCRGCYLKSLRHNQPFCIICGNKCSYYSNYCRKCYNKRIYGNNNPNFKGGKPRCQICEKIISYISKYCSDCWYKFNIGKNNKLYGKSRYNGKENPNWQDGISCLGYPYIFNENLKQEIRLRDNFTCQCCNVTEKEHIQKFKRKLTIHHIDYNKQNCKEDNLITVCSQCNLRANFNRDYWFAYYTYIMENYI